VVIPERKEAKNMSKAISLKLKDEIFLETEEIIRRNRRPRNAYFNEAIRLYNLLWKRKMLKKALAEESSLVAEDSLEVLAVFEQIEDKLTK
jgi:predicted transcriptional regulator